jgi:DNA-directed RNA polymerase specialized sigma24 family protein
MDTLGTKVPEATTAPQPGATTEIDPPLPANDNGRRGGVPDTTSLVARPEVVQSIRATLRRYRVAQQDIDDAIAEVQVESIEAARARAMPCDLAQWKALATKVGAHWALDRLREAKVRSKYDAGLCDDPDAYLRPTLRWEHADPVDTKRYLAVLKGLFDAGQMPEHGEEILQGEADGVPHDEIAAEIGVSTTVVHNRLSRMRAKFRARLAALGMLALALLILFALLSPGPKVVASAPPPPSENRSPPSEEIAPLPLK